MRKLSTTDWAATQEFSMGRMEEYLEILGYQTLARVNGKVKWKLTEKGRAHARISHNPFAPGIRWDFEAFLECVRLHEKRGGKDVQVEGMDGVEIEGADRRATESEECKAVERSLANVKCTKCGREAHGLDKVIAMFGFEEGEGKVRVCEECKRG